MLDDTCYLIGFDKIEFAVYSLILLNSNPTMDFLRSITFKDAKRTFTKDILKLVKNINKQELLSELNKLNEMYKLNLNLNLWDSFLNMMNLINNQQISMFA